MEALEANYIYRMNCLGEPQLGKYGLYPTVSTRGQYSAVRSLQNFIVYADGKNDLIAMSDLIGVPVATLVEIAGKKIQAGNCIRNIVFNHVRHYDRRFLFEF